MNANDDAAIWKALANPTRRQLLDALRDGPRTTGELAEAQPELSRFAVMQHLGVLTDAGLILVRRQGRERFNHLNAAPVQRVYERWVSRLAGDAAGEALSIGRLAEASSEQESTQEQGNSMSDRDTYRVVRIENELRFSAAPETVFEVLTRRSQEWFRLTYGGERTRAVVLEERVGGALYEDWGDGSGHHYGHVTHWDPPAKVTMRTQLGPATVMDTTYDLTAEGEETVFAMSRVVAGPISEEEAEGIHQHGDFRNFEAALRELIEGE